MAKEPRIIEAGPLRFLLEYRQDIQEDQGVSLRVVAADGAGEQLLRFDCFDQEPAYVYGPDGRGERVRLDKTTAGNPIGWSLRQLRTRLPEMLRRAGDERLAAAVDSAAIAPKLDEVEAAARTLAATERRTVTHNRGDAVFEAGGIRFGLEYRRFSFGEGLAVHVLSDVAGQEIELLAFDCFDRGAHYHYGPRNKDIRIFWDQTLVPDTLGWVFAQFKQGRLPAMIERAGYPGVVAELDEALIAEKLPEIEAAARAIVREATAAPATVG